MAFKFSTIDKNNLYHNIRLHIKENDLNEATKSILVLFENFIEQNLNQESNDDEETLRPAVDLGGTFRRVE